MATKAKTAPKTEKQATAQNITVEKISLPPARKLTGDAIYNLTNLMNKAFVRITVRMGDQDIIIHDTADKNQVVKMQKTELGLLHLIVYGTLSGRGDVPEGVVMYLTSMKGNNLVRNVIEANPLFTVVPAGRSGPSGYEFTVQQAFHLMEAREAIIGPSLEKFPPEKAERTVEKDDEPTDVTVGFSFLNV